MSVCKAIKILEGLRCVEGIKPYRPILDEVIRELNEVYAFQTQKTFFDQPKKEEVKEEIREEIKENIPLPDTSDDAKFVLSVIVKLGRARHTDIKDQWPRYNSSANYSNKVDSELIEKGLIHFEGKIRVATDLGKAVVRSLPRLYREITCAKDVSKLLNVSLAQIPTLEHKKILNPLVMRGRKFYDLDEVERLKQSDAYRKVLRP